MVLVTGAGGSIGKELCRQILLLKPKSIVLFEINEPSLYLIDQELRDMDIPNLEIFPISKIEYLELRNKKSLNISKKIKGSKLFVAYYLKNIRLIDNI